MKFQTVKIWDAPMGQGKTSKAISMMNLNHSKKYIYITPILTEVTRIIKMCPNLNFKEPKISYLHPSKRTHLMELIENNDNIVSTHSLFLSNGFEMMSALSDAGYILILDEVVSVLDKYRMYSEKERRQLTEKQLENLSKRDIDGLIGLGVMSVSDDHKLVWNDGAPTLGKYHDVKHDSSQGLLYYINGKALMWSFPVEVFEDGLFDEIYILTYQFDVQLMGAYFRFFDVPIEKYSITRGLANDYVVVPFDEGEGDVDFRRRMKSLIHIVESKKMNSVGFPDSRTRGWGKLSYTWWDELSKPYVKSVSKNILNFYKNIAFCKDEDRVWTVFKNSIKDFRVLGTSKENWLTFNSRATNDYRHKKSLVYLVNRYFSPSIKTFFKNKDVDMNQDAWALSELLQWIFRAAVRDGEHIDIFIPSFRMRELLKAYLANEPLESIYENDLSRRRAKGI